MTRLPVFVIGRYPPPFDGQSLATARCADLLATNREVRRISTEPPGPLLHHPDPSFSIGRALYFLRLGHRIRNALAQAPGAPVIWHSASPSALGHLRDILTTLPSLGEDRPVFAVLHRGSFHRLFESRWTRPTARLLARRVTGFIFQSKALADRCASWIPENKRHVIPHTIDEALLVAEGETRAKTETGPHRPLQMLFLSNMIQEKGYLDVLEAAVLLRRQGMPFHLQMAGNWPDDTARQAFEDRVQEACLADSVTHLGGVADRVEARRLHLQADVFLLPTTHPTETQPIAIIEALGAATPVIVTDRDVLRDLVGTEAPGTFVPPHAPTAIAGAIADLTNPSRWREASAAARARFDSAFSPSVVGHQWTELLQPESAPR